MNWNYKLNTGAELNAALKENNMTVEGFCRIAKAIVECWKEIGNKIPHLSSEEKFKDEIDKSSDLYTLLDRCVIDLDEKETLDNITQDTNDNLKGLYEFCDENSILIGLVAENER